MQVSVPKPSCHGSSSPTIPLGILWSTQLPNAKNWILSSSAVCLQPYVPRICISLISHDCSISTNSKRSCLIFHFSAVDHNRPVFLFQIPQQPKFWDVKDFQFFQIFVDQSEALLPTWMQSSKVKQ